MDRITQADLLHQVEEINRLMDTPQTAYSQDSNGKYQPNAGSYHLSWAYGGVTLEQMDCEGGTGTRNVFSSGFEPKRALYNRMRSYIAGIHAVMAHPELMGK